MRLDSANRSFLSLIGVAFVLGMYVLCGAVGSVLVPLLLARISRDGVTGLLRGDSLLPMLLFNVLVAVGLALGGRSLARQALAARRLASRVRNLAVALPDDLAHGAAEAELRGRVVLLNSLERFSFVYGALTPRVAVSRGLLEGVSGGELRAVLEHERYHVCNLDPLKAMLVQALSAAFFFLPALDSLRVRYVAARELASDRRAVTVCGRRPLAGALLKVVRGPDWSELEVAAPIGDPELLDVRVAQLETGRQPKLATPSVARATISLLGAALFATSFLTSVSSFGGPSAVEHATGTSASTANLLGGLTCATPFATVGLLAYWIVARRASRPLAASARKAQLPCSHATVTPLSRR